MTKLVRTPPGAGVERDGGFGGCQVLEAETRGYEGKGNAGKRDRIRAKS